MLVHFVEYYHDLIHSSNKAFLRPIHTRHTINITYLMSLMAGETMARFSGRIFEYSARFYSSPLAIFSVGDEELAYESMLKCNSKKAKGSFPGISDNGIPSMGTQRSPPKSIKMFRRLVHIGMHNMVCVSSFMCNF